MLEIRKALYMGTPPIHHCQQMTVDLWQQAWHQVMLTFTHIVCTLCDDVMTRNLFPQYWSFVRGSTGPRGFDILFVIIQHKLLNKQFGCITLCVRGIHWWPVDSPDKGLVLRTAFSCHWIMIYPHGDDMGGTSVIIPCVFFIQFHLWR